MLDGWSSPIHSHGPHQTEAAVNPQLTCTRAYLVEDATLRQADRRHVVNVDEEKDRALGYSRYNGRIRIR